MSGFLGANTDQLRDHAQLMQDQAQRLIELRDALAPAVMEESMWRGPDADRFRQEWSGQISSLFDLRHDELTQREGELEKHAEEQDEASGTGGGGFRGGDCSSEAPFDPFGFLKDTFMKVQGLWGKGKSLVSFLKRIPSAASEFAALAERGLQRLWKDAYLDELFKGGKEWQAGVEKLLDKLGIPNKVGNWEPLKFLNKIDDVAPFLKTAGKAVGEFLPYFDVAYSGVQSFQKFRDGDIYGGVSSGLSAVGSGLLIAAPFTGPAAPIVGAVGAGLGVVSIGMDIGKSVVDNWPQIMETAGNVGSAIADGASSVASTAGEAIGNVGSAIGDGVSSVGSAVGDALGGLDDALGIG